MLKGIVSIPSDGLANRLRNLCSSYIYAEFINVEKIYVHWMIDDNSMKSEWNDLFKNKLEIIDLKNKENMISSQIHNSNYLYLQPTGKNYSEDIYDQLTTETEYLILESGNEFIHHKMNKKDYLLKKIEFYKSLQPIDKISNYINQYINIVQNCIGIHYRDYNEISDSPEVLGGSYDSHHWKRHQIPHVENIIEKYINQDKNIKFYFCSNSPEVKKYFENKYSNNILILELNSYDRNNKETTQLSLVEWYLLSNCNKIYGSLYSSFSDEACYLNKIEKLFIGDEKIIMENILKGYHSSSCLWNGNDWTVNPKIMIYGLEN